MKLLQLTLQLIIVIYLVNGHEGEMKVRYKSDMGKFLNSIGTPVLASARRVLWRATNIKDLEEENRKDKKTQEVLLKMRPEYAEKFPCDPNGPGRRSPKVPNNVYEIRPGDIDIIAVMGDSLSSGNGGYSNQLLHIINEFRSISWSGGGKGSYKKYITLPNILKSFNPKLYGYSVTNGISRDKGSKLNLAEPMTMSPDLVFQAKTLINRMLTDPHVDVNSHWKMLTIFVGNNDFCSDSCHYKSFEEWVQLHKFELIKALRILRNNVPKLIINLIGLPNYTQLFKIKNIGFVCYVAYRVGCHCLFKPNMTETKLNSIKKGIDLWNDMDKTIANIDEFHTEDFAVIYQPLLTNVNFFKDEKNGFADFSYMANDCFHFSQLGHAIIAIGLWQNLMEPVGNKTRDWNPSINKDFQIKCPTEESPYIKVPKNNIIL